MRVVLCGRCPAGSADRILGGRRFLPRSSRVETATRRPGRTPAVSPLRGGCLGQWNQDEAFEFSAPRHGEALECLAAGGHTELAKQALHVRAHRVLGDVQAAGDLVGSEVLVEQQQHLDLAR